VWWYVQLFIPLAMFGVFTVLIYLRHQQLRRRTPLDTMAHLPPSGEWGRSNSKRTIYRYVRVRVSTFVFASSIPAR
jgi:hypothetical protein